MSKDDLENHDWARRPEIQGARPTVPDWFIDIEKLYPPECLKTITAHLGSLSSEAKQQLRTDILDTATEFHCGLHYEAAPTTAEIRRELADLKKKLFDVRAAFDGIDVGTIDWVIAAASRDPFDPQSEPAPYESADGPLVGSARFDRALRELDRLGMWLDRAEAFVGLGKVGRKKQQAAKDAAERLKKAWLNIPTNSRPTFTPFLAFVRAALLPVQKHHGADIKLERAVKDVLYITRNQKNPG